VPNLTPGAFRGIFKNLHPDIQDMRLYDCLQLFTHAEDILAENDNSMLCNSDLENGDLSLFVRLGSDFEQNYYEYKIPLVVSNPDLVSGLGSDAPEYAQAVWPLANQMLFSLKLLKEAKIKRDEDSFNPQERYIVDSTALRELLDSNDLDANDNAVVTVLGYPNLGLVKSMMIGVVNEQDMLSETRCAEIWVNEMRLGFDEKGGMRMDVQLADFGNLSAAGSYTSVGWGSIDQKLMERSLDETLQYDVSTNLELGKFFPEEWGVKLPFYALYSNEVSTPKYDANQEFQLYQCPERIHQEKG